MNAQPIATGRAGQACATIPHLVLALAAVDAARVQLDRYALATDEPAWCAVDATDALDAAPDLLAKAVRHA
jgi:hypothetical protein